MDELDAKETLVGAYNFLYLPIDFKNNCNLGYAFVNMRTTNHVLAMYETMQGKQKREEEKKKKKKKKKKKEKHQISVFFDHSNNSFYRFSFVG
jgi:tRNA C32,U32 (ribose-2'-O)-methylase TrmJ